MRTDEITNSADILDSRNIQERYDDLTQTIEDAFSDAGRDSFDFLAAWDKDEKKTGAIVEYLIKRDLLDESEFEEWTLIRYVFIDNMSDFYEWDDGMVFLRNSYMNEDWAEQEMEDLGYLSRDLPYPIRDNINFAGILEDLRNDYNELDFDGVTYWYRNY